jgi:hypothetical protein
VLLLVGRHGTPHSLGLVIGRGGRQAQVIEQGDKA